MKKIIFSLMFVTAALVFMNFTIIEESESKSNPMPTTIEIPNDVQEILDNSCYGCHNSESKNNKGKMKLKFDQLNDYKTHKVIGKLTDIAEVIAENDMPPAKILKKYPDMTLTDEQKETLSSWATATAKSLAGE